MSEDNTQPPSLIGTTIGGKYNILERIGGGGMGEVYKARHTLMDRIVAVKLLHLSLVTGEREEFVKRFEREAKTASKLDHPNAVTIYDFGMEKGQPYLVMQYVEGKSLKKLLLDNGAMKPERVVALMKQVCDAVTEAHELGIVHRDLKPDNIVVSKTRTGSETAIVLDFGIAKVIRGKSSELTQMTHTGSLLGTPRYMSPEQIQGRKVCSRADIYSLGIITYEMLAGDVPFQSDSLMEMLLKHMNEAPPSLRQLNPALKVPSAVEAAVMRSLEKEPSKRPQTSVEYKRDLERALQGISPARSNDDTVLASASVETRGSSLGRLGVWSALAFACLLLGYFVGVQLPKLADSPKLSNLRASKTTERSDDTALLAALTAKKATPTIAPTLAPQPVATKAQTIVTTGAPAPTREPTLAPTRVPTRVPTVAPTRIPTAAPKPRATATNVRSSEAAAATKRLLDKIRRSASKTKQPQAAIAKAKPQRKSRKPTVALGPEATLTMILNSIKRSGSVKTLLDYIDWEDAYTKTSASDRVLLTPDSPAGMKSFLLGMARDPNHAVKLFDRRLASRFTPAERIAKRNKLANLGQKYYSKLKGFISLVRRSTFNIGRANRVGNRATMRLTTYVGGKKQSSEEVTLVKRSGRWMLPGSFLFGNR